MKTKHLKNIGYPAYERMTLNPLYPTVPLFPSIYSYIHIFIFIDISEEEQRVSAPGRIPNPVLRFISSGAAVEPRLRRRSAPAPHVGRASIRHCSLKTLAKPTRSVSRPTYHPTSHLIYRRVAACGPASRPAAHRRGAASRS